MFAGGLRLAAVAVECDRPVDGSKLSPASFRGEGRTVTAVHASSSLSPGKPASAGPDVVVALSPDDRTFPPGGSAIQSTRVVNPVIDDFRPLEHRDPETGRILA